LGKILGGGGGGEETTGGGGGGVGILFTSPDTNATTIKDELEHIIIPNTIRPIMALRDIYSNLTFKFRIHLV